MWSASYCDNYAWLIVFLLESIIIHEDILFKKWSIRLRFNWVQLNFNWLIAFDLVEWSNCQSRSIEIVWIYSELVKTKVSDKIVHFVKSLWFFAQRYSMYIDWNLKQCQILSLPYDVTGPFFLFPKQSCKPQKIDEKWQNLQHTTTYVFPKLLKNDIKDFKADIFDFSTYLK